MKPGVLVPIILTVVGMMLGFLAYANDWQRQQDARLAEHDTLIEKQKILLEMQIKLNEQFYHYVYY